MEEEEKPEVEATERVKSVFCKTSLEEQGEIGSIEVTVEVTADTAGIFQEQQFLSACLTGPSGEEADRIFPLPLQKQMQFCMQAECPVLWNAELPGYYELILEIGDGEEICAWRRMIPVAFYEMKVGNGKLYVNHREVPARAERLPSGLAAGQELSEFLGRMKRSFRNTLLAPKECWTEQLREKCIQYGIYLVAQEEFWTGKLPEECPEKFQGKPLERKCRDSRKNYEYPGKSMQENPDFELQIIQTGVLIENRSVFQNASEFELYYQVTGPDDISFGEPGVTSAVEMEKKKGEQKIPGYQNSGTLQADVPPGSSRFVEVPFGILPEPGKYTFYAALRLKRDTIWAKAGFPVAGKTVQISGFYRE